MFKFSIFALIFAMTAHAHVIQNPVNGDPCDTEDDIGAQYCLMIGAPLAGTIVSPFVNHRSCGITNNAVIVVRIKQLANGSFKRIKEISAPLANSPHILDIIASHTVAGIEIPTFPVNHNPMANFWIVTDLADNRPVPGKRILLKTLSTNPPDPFQDNSDAAQFLIHTLEANCGSFDPASNLNF